MRLIRFTVAGSRILRDFEREAWLALSRRRLEAACDDDEEGYTAPLGVTFTRCLLTP